MFIARGTKFTLRRRGASPSRPWLCEGTGTPQISRFAGPRCEIIVPRPNRGLCAVLDSYSPKKPFHVHLHRFLGDVESGGAVHPKRPRNTSTAARSHSPAQAAQRVPS